MKSIFQKEPYNSIVNSIERGEPYPVDMADQVATAMKSWAWVKVPPIIPTGSSLTGTTAENAIPF